MAAPVLHIGSKRFTESYILAEILAQTARLSTAEAATSAATAAPNTNATGAKVPVGTEVQVLAGLGNTAIVYQALRQGTVDLYPEYMGTIDQEILKNTGASSMAAMNQQLAPLGLGVAIPFGFNDGYALAVRGDTAQRMGLQRLSDLAQHPALRFGLSNEFLGRADGWRGLAQRYHLSQTPTGLDHGLAYQAVAQGQVDVIDIYTTDAQIEPLKLQVLADDQHYFPRYDAVVLYRLDVPQRFPRAWQALQSLTGTIDEHAMIAMNAQAELQGVSFAAIARGHLAAQPLPTTGPHGTAGAGQVVSAVRQTAPDNTPPAVSGFWARLFGPDLGRLAWQHFYLVALSVAAAVLVGVPLATAVAPHPRLRAGVLGLTGLLQTIPSLALLAVLISALGAIGTLPALLALSLYALLPVMRNTCTGLAEVPAGLKLAGQALGLSPGQVLRHIALPLAGPTITAGVRTATTIAIGTATIAAFIGAGGFGERIVTGLALNDKALLLAGALPAALMALASEALFEGLERWLRRR